MSPTLEEKEVGLRKLVSETVKAFFPWVDVVRKKGSLYKSFYWSLKRNVKLIKRYTIIFIHQVRNQHLFMVCLKCTR